MREEQPKGGRGDSCPAGMSQRFATWRERAHLPRLKPLRYFVHCVTVISNKSARSRLGSHPYGQHRGGEEWARVTHGQVAPGLMAEDERPRRAYSNGRTVAPESGWHVRTESGT